MKSLVIYHADCTDGYGAAFAAWTVLGDEAVYLPVQHGGVAVGQLAAGFNQFRLCTPGGVVEVADREVYILDFSFLRPIMDGLFAHAKRVVWLDHHLSSQELAEEFCPPQPYPVETHQDRFEIIHDSGRSGALLAWEYFQPGTEVPLLIQHIDDRDRWQWKLEGSAAIHAALSSYQPWSFEQWKGWLTFEYSTWDDMLQEGEAILRAQKQHVERMAKQVRKCEISTWAPQHGPDIGDTVTPSWSDGYLRKFIGLAVNAPIHQSEVGHELANQSGTYGLVYYIAADNRVRCALRSNGDYDVSEIARTFGGGGHRNAAGFETDIETLMGWLK